MARLNSGGVALIVLVTLGLLAMLMMSVPDRNISTEQSNQSNITEIPAVYELKILNVGLTSLTLNWTQAQDRIKPSIFQIYQDTILIATVPGSIHIYNITGLTANTWYQFSVKACSTSGNCSDNGSLVGVNTLTVQQATELVMGDVDNLASMGVLDQKQGTDLIDELAVIYQLDIDTNSTVIDSLQNFINDVNSLIDAGVLPPETGRPLVDAIKDVIKNIPE